MTFPRFLIMLCLAFGVAAPAVAAERKSATILPPDGEVIRLSSSTGKLLRLPRSAVTVFVADATVADVNVRSKRLIYLFGKKPGETTLYAIDKRERIVIAQRIFVGRNIDQLRSNVRALYPDLPVRIRTAGPKLVLTGRVPDADTAQQIFSLAVGAARGTTTNVINNLQVTAPTQVNIRVKFAEVSRSISKRIGFNWEVLGNLTANYMLGFAVGNDIVRTPGGGFIFPGDDKDRIFSSFQNNNVFIDTVIELLDDEGLITVLAEPNLTAKSGETAEFLAGGEFPIAVSSGEDKTTLEFKQFGVSVSFTPTIVSENRINLVVRSEVSELTDAGGIQANGFNIPSLSTRRALTTVELGSGQSFAIAGLLQNTTNQALSDIPGMKDIPILGALFRSDEFQRQESELMIVVTPYIVRPTSARIPLPIDKYLPPKDLERFLLGRNHVKQPASGPAAPLDPHGRPGLVGPAGFVLQ